MVWIALRRWDQGGHASTSGRPTIAKLLRIFTACRDRAIETPKSGRLGARQGKSRPRSLCRFDGAN